MKKTALRLGLALLLLLLPLSDLSFVYGEKDNTSLLVVGRVPGEYLEDAKKEEHHLAYIVMKDRIITDLKKLTEEEAEELKKSNTKDLEKKFPQARIILAKGSSGKFDVLYPGLIDLHNHTKQNNLGVWKEARGQFYNRFEWRAWGNYTKAVSGNMNPWIGYGKAITCAAFRWSEMQALVLGTTYLQGPSSCVSDFAIHRVEDKSSYISKKKAVQSPTDIIIPADMVFVWETLAPIIRKGKSYEEALAQVLTTGTGEWSGCPGLKGVVTAENINTKEIAGDILGDKNVLKEKCDIKPELPKKELDKLLEEQKVPNKFIRYMYWVHKTIASKKNYLASENPSAIITHLGEGRRMDHYNRQEFELLELLGLVQPYVNLVHGVGTGLEEMKKMAQNKMGFIWSPFSNLLLYGETLDLKALKQAEKETGKEILIALGSDWLPTGSKSVLEELIVARNYVEKFKLKELGYDDEALYKMVTENPAKMIRHWEINPEKGEHGIGRLKVAAMASIIVLSNNHENPYTNLVWNTEAKDVNLVLVDGKPIYGNKSYLEQLGIKEDNYETLPNYIGPRKEWAENPSQYVPTPTEGMEKADKEAQLKALASYVYETLLKGEKEAKAYSEATDHCNFPEQKAFLHQNSLSKNGVEDFQEENKINLDRFSHIQALLAIHLLSQSRNANEIKGGDRDYAVKYFPPLYSCNDVGYGEIDHLDRVKDMIKPGGKDSNERDLENREKLREELRLGSFLESLTKKYPEPGHEDCDCSKAVEEEIKE